MAANHLFPTSDEDSSTPDYQARDRSNCWFGFPTSDEDSSTPDQVAEAAKDAGEKFPTSDEDSSTPDSAIGSTPVTMTVSFRPLTRIHLLLTANRTTLAW